MRMNRTEKFLMNNPIRAAMQRWYEAPLLERLGGRTEDMRVLECGCGQGVGTELIFNRFGAREIYAIDLDPDMIQRARKRLSGYPPERLKLEVGDVTALPVEDASFDAVFDFAILHHVPNWQSGVSEIHRVLKPGGRFYFQDVTTHALNKWFYQTFLEHPTENRFSGAEFIAELERQGIAVKGNFLERNRGDFIYGVGCRTS
ncbi:MAG: class I SAM-dependent methyltransferase [Gallionellaceae bacterium]